MTAIEFHAQLVTLKDSLEKYAYHLTFKSTEAKDLVQETFLKALINKEKYSIEGNMRAWAFTIMKNTFLNNYRRNIRQQTYCDAPAELRFISHTRAISTDNADVPYMTKEIVHNIKQLRDPLRIPFEMRIDGYKYKEIADQLNISIGTVKSRIYLSRKQLMSQLQN